MRLHTQAAVRCSACNVLAALCEANSKGGKVRKVGRKGQAADEERESVMARLVHEILASGGFLARQDGASPREKETCDGADGRSDEQVGYEAEVQQSVARALVNAAQVNVPNVLSEIRLRLSPTSLQVPLSCVRKHCLLVLVYVLSFTGVVRCIYAPCTLQIVHASRLIFPCLRIQNVKLVSDVLAVLDPAAGMLSMDLRFPSTTCALKALSVVLHLDTCTNVACPHF
jgi:hypothetical protein